MDASVDQSDGECEFDDSDDGFYNSKTGVQLKKEPGPWIARNPARLLEVINLKLELPDNVSNISDSIGDLHNLKRLIIKTGINLNSLPHTLPTLLHLRKLQLENCPNLSQLPSNFGNLVALRFLIIRNCGIKFLPQSLSLLQLWKLELNNCVFIQELPATLYVNTLILSGCHVKSFSTKPRILHWLEINYCLYVNDILTTLNHFDSLLILHIKGCDMESLPNSITGIHNLTYLDIEDCINLRRLPQNLSQLAHLILINCGLESIPSGLRSLTSLSIKNCPMEFLVIKESVSLVYVRIKSCHIKSLNGCITGLTKLERLIIQDCVALEDLPTDINTLVSLETLCIEGCTSIKFLPSLAALHNLKQLSLKGCSSIKFLPNIAELHNLEFLSLEGCSMIDELLSDFDELTNLESLRLTDTNVQSLPSTILKLPNLKYVDLPGCFRFETLLPNNFDLKRIHIFLPLSFRLDTLPPKFSVIRLHSAYQLHLKDQKESRLELINDKECDVDDADKSNGYWQTMVKTPSNVTHLPQPRPDGEACPEESRQAITHNQTPLNRHLNLALTLQPFTIPEESWQDVFDDQTNSEKTFNLLDPFHIPDEQVLAETQGYLSAFLNLDIGRNHTGFAHDGDGPSKQIEASEYLHGKDKHMMNYSRVMSQRESRDSESIDSTSHCVTSKALAKEATSLLRTEKGAMSRAIGDDHGMKQRKSQIGTSDGRCDSILSSTQDKMYTVRAKHKENEINFNFKAESSFAAVKQELAERLTLDGGKLKIKYSDSSKNLDKAYPNASIVRDWMLMTCDADLRRCERYSRGMEIWLSIEENHDLATESTLVVKAIYKDALIRFEFLSTSSLAKLKEEVLLRLPLEENKIKIKYQDDEDDWVLLACPRDLQHCLRLSTSRKSNIIRLMIFDS